MKTRKTLMTLALAGTVGSFIFMTSCSDDPIVAPTVSYANSTIAVGTEGAVVPTVEGDEATFTIVDAGDAEDFVTINTATGEITVADESTTGEYEIKVKATNEAGFVDATLTLTIGINPAGFNPTGKSYVWQYFMNLTSGLVIKNLDKQFDGAPAGDIPITTGWPPTWPAITADDEPYFVFNEIQRAIFQVPGDDACTANTPGTLADNLNVTVNSDLTLSTKCKADMSGATVEIGTSAISYVGGKYIWSLDMAFQGIPITYTISNLTSVAAFIDPLLGGATYPALTGTVDLFTTPTDFDPAKVLTSLRQVKVDVVLQVK